MKTPKKIFIATALAFLVFGGMSCCKENAADFGQVGVLGKLATPTSAGGTHFIGDTATVGTTNANYNTYVSYNSAINLDQYIGDTVVVSGAFVGQVGNGNIPDLIEVFHIKR